MGAATTVTLREGAVEDRVRVQGNFLELQRWTVSSDPRCDELELRQVLLRIPLHRARAYVYAIENAVQDADAESTLANLVPERPR